ERSLFQKIAVVATLDIFPGAHKSIEEFAAFVIAEINDHFAVLGDDKFGIFMLEAAERGALFRRRGGIFGIDFNDIAESVWLVRVLADIKARLHAGPAIPPVLVANAIARHRGGGGVGLIAARKITVEVFLAGEVGAPRRPAVAAVVERAKRAGAGGIRFRLHQGVA